MATSIMASHDRNINQWKTDNPLPIRSTKPSFTTGDKPYVATAQNDVQGYNDFCSKFRQSLQPDSAKSVSQKNISTKVADTPSGIQQGCQQIVETSSEKNVLPKIGGKIPLKSTDDPNILKHVKNSKATKIRQNKMNRYRNQPLDAVSDRIIAIREWDDPCTTDGQALCKDRKDSESRITHDDGSHCDNIQNDQTTHSPCSLEVKESLQNVPVNYRMTSNTSNDVRNEIQSHADLIKDTKKTPEVHEPPSKNKPTNIPKPVRLQAVSKTLNGMLQKDDYYARDFQWTLETNITDLDITEIQGESGHSILHNMIAEFKASFLYVIFYLNLWSALREVPVASNKGSSYANLKPRELCEKLMPKAKGPLVLEEFDYYDALDVGMTELMRACLKGALNDVKNLLKKLTPSDLHYKDTSGFNCFPYAAASGNLEICEMLLQNDVDPNTVNDRDESALHIAAKLGRSKVIPFLLRRCSMLDPSRTDKSSYRPIDYVAMNGDIASMKVFCETGNDLLVDDKCVALAGKHGRTQMVQYLLEERKLSIEGKDDHGRTALLNACCIGNKELVEYLLKMEADITNVDRQRRNCLHLAADNGRHKLIDFLLKTLKSEDLLESLMNAKDQFCGREIVILVRGRDRGRAAWHYVQIHRCLMHHFRVQLGRGSIDVNDFGMILSSGFGRSPASADRQFMENMLRDRLSDSEDNPDMTPLHIAVYKEHTNIVKALLEAGASPNNEDKFGLTPLHLAAMRGNMEAAKLLDKHGAEFDIRNEQDHTPADIADANCHEELENFLRGKEYTIAVKKGKEALLQTLAEFSEERLEGLRQSGSDVRRHLVAMLRDMSIDINETLLALGSGPVMEETQQSRR